MSEEKWKDIDQLMYKELAPDRYCYIHNYIIDLKSQLQQKENIIKELKEDKSKMFETAVKRNNQLLDRIEKLKLIIATAIRIYEDCAETQDYSTCDLDMYECLKKVERIKEVDLMKYFEEDKTYTFKEIEEFMEKAYEEFNNDILNKCNTPDVMQVLFMKAVLKGYMCLLLKGKD